MNVTGLKSVPRYLPDMVCMTLNESTATPHARGKTKSQPNTNNRKDSLSIWAKLTMMSDRRSHPRLTELPSLEDLLEARRRR